MAPPHTHEQVKSADAEVDDLRPRVGRARSLPHRLPASLDPAPAAGGHGTPRQNTTTPCPLVVRYKTARVLFEDFGCSPRATEGGDAPTPKVIAALQLDGGTRMALAFDPAAPLPPATKDELDRLRRSRSPQEKRALRESGGLFTWIRVDGQSVAAKVSVSGDWRERLTLHVADRIYAYVDLHAGKLYLQFKAKELWGFGFANAARWWADAFSRLFGCRPCATLDDVDAEWHMTGVEICTDFQGLPRWDATDLKRIVGVRVVRSFHQAPDDDAFSDQQGRMNTLNLGTRSSRVSACLYDKDVQLSQAKPERAGGTPRGDDSTYRAVHLAGGWDGRSNRQRVEFRFHGEALQLEHIYSRAGIERGTGEVWDFRRPSTLANREALGILWRKAAQKKRIVDVESATRRERCVLDARWRYVIDAADVPVVDLSEVRWRREVPVDTHAVRLRRTSRAMARNIRSFAALLDLPTNTTLEISRVVHVSENLITLDDDVDWRDEYQEKRRAEFEALMKDEIRNRGSPMARSILSHAMGVLVDGARDLEDFFSEEQLERMLARKRAKAIRAAYD